MKGLVKTVIFWYDHLTEVPYLQLTTTRSNV